LPLTGNRNWLPRAGLAFWWWLRLVDRDVMAAFERAFGAAAFERRFAAAALGRAFGAGRCGASSMTTGGVMQLIMAYII
jgi:hypothetical protein